MCASPSSSVLRVKGTVEQALGYSLDLGVVSWSEYLELALLRIYSFTICQHREFGDHSSPTLGNATEARPRPSDHTTAPRATAAAAQVGVHSKEP